MKLGFGTMRLPCLDGDNTKIDLDETQKLVDAFLAAGGTYFDTAYPYHGGMSEAALRETVVKRYPRERFTVADKLPMFSITKAEQMQQIFDEQQMRCGVEYFDYYLLHALGKKSYEVSQQIHAFEFAAAKKAEGKIRHVGFSFHDSPEMLDRILTEHPEVEFVQLQINYLDWDDPEICSEKCYEIACRHGKPVIVMEPVKGGALAGIPKDAEKLLRAMEPESSMASWAVRFAASLDNVMMVLSGMSNMEQVQDNLCHMKDFKTLSAVQQDTVMQAAEAIRASIAVPCTACRYCTDGCPKKIAIPDTFMIYNNLKRFGEGQLGRARGRYQDLLKEHGKASECIQCGKCEEHCPQHLMIRDYLKQAAAALEPSGN